ncbi:hypothetical protein [Glaciihabitans sp. INWT7]|uniref:hypothetical protein n=1 Tax=Glaciihabitans sp. INWT7 TaxID=2596912 RepID=UPI001627FDC3|nr:hypothetical protein [Glaciihabitans sp. INWT7]
MASWSCPVCGEEADEDQVDPHGHFSSEGECEICGDQEDEHTPDGDQPDHEFESAD